MSQSPPRPNPVSLAQPTAERPHVDRSRTILFVCAHPDDEAVFGGGLIPYYALSRNAKVVLLNLVTRNPDGSHPLSGAGRFRLWVAFTTALRLFRHDLPYRSQSRVELLRDALCLIASQDKGKLSRIQQLRNALNIYAGNTAYAGSFDNDGHYVSGNIELVEGGLIDTGCGDRDPATTWFDEPNGKSWGRSKGVCELTPGYGNLQFHPNGRLAAATTIAATIRRHRPDIVACIHDVRGDYGHSDHTATAIATIEADLLAADPSEQIDDLPPWQASKLYLHGRPEDNHAGLAWQNFVSNGGLHGLFHEYLEVDTGRGLSFRGLARSGLECHFTEGPFDVLTVFRRDEVFESYCSEWWTLYRSSVGSDSTSSFVIDGDVTGQIYQGWARGDFLEHI